jgi:hypothetical protein
MRFSYLICYDICDDKRLRKVFQIPGAVPRVPWYSGSRRLPLRGVYGLKMPDDVVIGDLFSFATDSRSYPLVHIVVSVSAKHIEYWPQDEGRNRATQEEFAAMGPYCSILGHLAFQIEWCRVNGMSPEECRELLDRQGGSAPPG